MKDELQELEMDESTRKTATDWLMHVISGKRSNGNGSGLSGESVSGGAVALAEMPPPEMPRAPEVTQEFTAEDLCGAPAVPVVKVIAPKDDITADDVCWVPEEMRLKPQSPTAEEPPASKVHVMPSPETREDVDLRRPAASRDPELSFLTGPSDSVVTSADISRSPAPYVVEPTWNGMISGPEPDEIKASDLVRGSQVNHAPEPTGSDLPTSFRVIRSISTQPAEPAAPVIEAPAPIIEAPAPVAEAVASVFEAQAPVIEAPAPAAEAAPSVMEAPASMFEAPAPVSEAPAAVSEMRPTVFDAPATVFDAPAPVFETPASVVEAAPPTMEAAVPVIEGAAQGSAEAVAEAAALSAHAEPKVPATETPQAHSSDPVEETDPRSKQSAANGEIEGEVKGRENVFARQGFWGETTKAEASESETSPKAILRGMKRGYPASGPEDFEKHPEGWFSAWKTMLRLGSVLPWVARALPALESGALGVEPDPTATAVGTGTTGVAQETRQDVAGLRLVQYEIRTTVQDHSMQLKRVEEQLTRVRESVDSRSSENAEVAANLRAMAKLMRLAGVGLGVLLLVLIVLVVVMMAHR